MDLVVSKVVRQFVPFLGDFRFIKHQRLKPLLILGLCVHLLILFLVALSGFFSPDSTLPIADIMQAISYFNCLNNHFLLWRARELFSELAEKMTKLLHHPEVQIDPEIHRKLLLNCQARQSVIKRWCLRVELFVSWAYVFPPIMAFFSDDSPNKILRMPHGSRDPFPLADYLAPGHWLRLVLYPIYSLSTIINVVVVFHGHLVTVLLFDSLKTLFLLSGLSFRHLSGSDFSGSDRLATSIRYHQCLFRISSKIKKATEPFIAVHVLGSAGYLVFTILLALQAEEIGSKAYQNRAWMERKNIDAKAANFLITVMRAHQPIKFRILNCFVMSEENFLQYLQNVYRLFIVLRSVT